MKAAFPIISRSRLRVTVGLIVLAVAVGLFWTNQRYSIQFTGGVEIIVDAPELDEGVKALVTQSLTENGMIPGSVLVGTKDEFATLLVQMSLTDDTQVQKVTDLLKQTLLDNQIIASEESILEQSVIGPSIGAYMKKSAVLALTWGTVFMAVYILFAFASMRHLISPAYLAVITILTLLFDVAIPAGMYGLWMAINPAVQIDAIFIIALLTIMGYSINDTIIIFDRIRENYAKHEDDYNEGKRNVDDLFETSLRQTMKRSLGTSFTTFLVVTAMWLFGTGALKLFAFTFGVGVIFGSFSSIFFAAPLAYLFSKKTLQKKHS